VRLLLLPAGSCPALPWISGSADQRVRALPRKSRGQTNNGPRKQRETTQSLSAGPEFVLRAFVLVCLGPLPLRAHINCDFGMGQEWALNERVRIVRVISTIDAR
jgi:hypothetical protein